MSQIIIQLQGGLVQGVFIKGTGKPTKAIVVDEDCEGCEPADLTSLEDCTREGYAGRRYEAIIGSDAILPLPKGSDLDLIVKKYQKGA